MLRHVQIVGLLTLIFLVGQTYSECNVCQTNRAACINSTSYYMCFGADTPYTDTIYSCQAGFQCSDRTAICIQKTALRPPSCGDTSKCGLCSAHRDYKFACQSRGVYQWCFGASRPTGPLGDCPKGTVCDANSDEICVPEEENQTLTCDLYDELVQTTTAIPDPTFLTPKQVCERKGNWGLYETVPRDLYCKSYISCYFNKGTIQAVEYNCSATSYFEADAQRCHYIKPFNCI